MAKVLGMWWETRRVIVHFNFDPSRIGSEILNGIRRSSKREVLKTLMSIYDPLRLISQFLLYVKMLIQDI